MGNGIFLNLRDFFLQFFDKNAYFRHISAFKRGSKLTFFWVSSKLLSKT